MRNFDTEHDDYSLFEKSRERRFNQKNVARETLREKRRQNEIIRKLNRSKFRKFIDRTKGEDLRDYYASIDFFIRCDIERQIKNENLKGLLMNGKDKVIRLFIWMVILSPWIALALVTSSIFSFLKQDGYFVFSFFCLIAWNLFCEFHRILTKWHDSQIELRRAKEIYTKQC